MAKQISAGVGGVVKKVSKVPLSIGGVVKQAKKGVCGVGGVIKTFFESTILTSISNPNTPYYWYTNGSETYINWNANADDVEFNVYMYGDFANRTYSLYCISDGVSTYVYSVNASGEQTSLGWVNPDSWTTFSGTFPSDTSYIRLFQYINADYSRSFRLQNFVIDGVDRMDEIKSLRP